MSIKEKTKKGFVAIATVLVLSVVTLALATTVAFLSIGEAQSGFALVRGEETLSFVEGCVEDALLKARASDAYAGGNITRPEGTCSVSVSKGGLVWTLTVSTSATVYRRTIQAVVNRTGSGVTITSWKEVP